jgi:hypothetical protein
VTNTLHIHPMNDLIDHDTSTDQADCPCGPEVRPVEGGDGSVGWMLVHHSLDGREQVRGVAGRWPGGPG